MDIDKYLTEESDELNPKYLFSMTDTRLLIKMLKDKKGFEHYARMTLAERGVDANGKWIGFDKAEKIWKVSTTKKDLRPLPRTSKRK